ncbi:hypothetical protein WJX81_007900 [Elliptochloris bilobata]|uniref:RCK N-terminal domain-containing protein n=1 Tax=Elliptochloris bilobata TaxID=381761 RepID=A0AAW1SI97_9CHLO
MQLAAQSRGVFEVPGEDNPEPELHSYDEWSAWSDSTRISEQEDWVDAFNLPAPQAAPPVDRWQRIQRWRWNELREKLAYRYFCWRQDTWSDLQLVLVVNLTVITLFGWIKSSVVDVLDTTLVHTGPKPFWLSIYEVMKVVFGQDLADESAGVAQQVFSVSVAIGGLAAFALVLALIEQVVLQVLDDNVKRGSRVFESNHVLILGWCDSQRDLEVVQKVVSQLCHAYEAEDGRVIVVMTQRAKLELEALFRRILPAPQRFGSQLVFRQGSPLVPADLRKVAAASAAATVIVSDSSRSPVEADAEAIRAAVLLDEIMQAVPEQSTARIVVEVKTVNALSVLQYSCSARTMALHTGELNARRLSRMVKHPVVAAVTYIVWNFSMRPQVYLQRLRGFAGRRYSELQAYLPNATVYGLVQPAQRRCTVLPPADTVLTDDDEVVLTRAVTLPASEAQPLAVPVPIDLGNWDPATFRSTCFLDAAISPSSSLGAVVGAATSTEDPDVTPEDRALQAAAFGSFNGSEWGARPGGRPALAARVGAEGGQAAYMFVAPLQELSMDDACGPEAVLICGFPGEAFMGDLLRELDHGPAALPAGSSLTLFHANAPEGMLERVRARSMLRRLELRHVSGNPLEADEMTSRLDVTQYTTAIVLCDQSWVDPDLDDTNGIQGLDERRDVLRLESLILLVQLHLRKALQDAGYPDINIIAEKVAAEGQTRFEDRYRLPIGISVNMTSYSGKLLTAALYNPRLIMVYAQMGDACELSVQAAAALCSEDEELSYWQLMARAASVGRVLYGYYQVPDRSHKPIDFIINPEGMEVRSRKRRWNDGRTQLILLEPKQSTLPRPAGPSTDAVRGLERAAMVPWGPAKTPA